MKTLVELVASWRGKYLKDHILHKAASECADELAKWIEDWPEEMLMMMIQEGVKSIKKGDGPDVKGEITDEMKIVTEWTSQMNLNAIIRLIEGERSLHDKNRAGNTESHGSEDSAVHG